MPLVGVVWFSTGLAGLRQPLAKETFVYKVAGAELKVDVFRAAVRPAPAILWLHGGGLIFGTRTSLPPNQLERYRAAGFTVVAADYRLAPRTQLPAILADLTDLHGWVLKQAAVLGIDPARIGVVGHSAGGYLALMSGHWLHPSPQAIVSFYGYGDLTSEWLRRPDPFYLKRPLVSAERAEASVGTDIVAEAPAGQDRFSYYVSARQRGTWVSSIVGADPVHERALFERLSPLRQVTAAYPPALLLHGDADNDVPFEASVLMAETFGRVGVPGQLIRLAGKDHNFDRETGDPLVEHALDQVVTFLARHL